MVVKDIVLIPEDQRILIRNAVNRITDIANNLLSQHAAAKSNDSKETRANTCPELLVELILSVISEKRAQYNNSGVGFNLNIDALAYGVFADVSASIFKRILSNLIDNAIEATIPNKKPVVTICVKLINNKLQISISDEGCGISEELLPKIINGNSTKSGGNGLGLSNAIKTVKELWGGGFEIESSVNEGTTINIILPVVAEPLWFAPCLSLMIEQNIVIVDDDESIHQVWQSRFRRISTDFRFINFYQPDDFIDWCKAGYVNDCLFLIDFEYINNPKTGVDLIQEFKIGTCSYLVTSHYEDLKIRSECEKSGVKIIPKSFAAYIPLNLLHKPKKQVDLILIDDNSALTDAWTLRAASVCKNIATFNSINDFKKVLPYFNKTIPIYIDFDLRECNTGIELAKELHDQGFQTIYITTGYSSDNFDRVPWIKSIVDKNPPF